MRQPECEFDAVPELASLVVDLIEEVERLKRRLEAAGLGAIRRTWMEIYKGIE